MPAFDFEALHPDGRTQRGTATAASVRELRAQLRQQGLSPVRIQPTHSSGNACAQPTSRQALLEQHPSSASNSQGNTPAQPSSWWQRLRQPIGAVGRMAAPQRVLLTRQLAELAQAGLTIERSLYSLWQDAQLADDVRAAHVLSSLLEHVRGGGTFSAALREHPAVFDEVFCSVVAAGERSGALPEVLTRLADEMEAAQTLRSKLLGAALYPAIVSAIAVLIVVFLMVYVLPQVATAFASGRRALPLLTVWMLKLSAFLSQWWPWLLVTLALLVAAAALALKNTALRTRAHALALRLPLLGTLLGGYNAARFATTLGMLTAAGVPMLHALQSATRTVGNLALKADLADITRMVREGAPLGLALGQKPRLPRLLSTFATLGAQTGQLSPMLLRAGQQLGAALQRRALHLAAVLEPLLIVGMGAVVLLIVLAVLMPIIEMNSFVK